MIETAVQRDPATGRRIVQVTRATVAAAQARLAIGKMLGITPSETVKSGPCGVLDQLARGAFRRELPQ